MYFLSGLPKDVHRIISRYVFDGVVREVDWCVQWTSPPVYQYTQLFAQVVCKNLGGERDYGIQLASCKMCNATTIKSAHHFTSNGSYKYMRSALSRKKSVCWQLVVSNETPIDLFHSSPPVVTSVICGTMHYAWWEGSKLKVRPWFESNHCWQDLASKFMDYLFVVRN